MKIKLIKRWNDNASEEARAKALKSLKLVTAWIDMSVQQLQADEVLAKYAKSEIRRLIHVGSLFNDLKADVVESFAFKKKGRK